MLNFLKHRAVYLNLLFLLLASFLFLSSPLNAATYYVARSDSSASDSNSGSEASPWKTIQKAANTLVAGDTVYVKVGIYQELYAGFPTSYNPAIKPQKSGTAGNYITYMAYPGDSVIIDQQYKGGIFYVEKSYIKISGFELRNGMGGIVTSGNASHIIIENNNIHDMDAVHGANNGGIYFTPCSYCQVRNNSIHDIYVNGTNTQFIDGANSSAIHSYNMEFITIENNEFYNVYNGVFHKSSSGKTGALIKGNLIHDVTRGLFYDVMGSGDDPHINQRVTGNIIYNAKSGIALAAHSYDTAGRVNDGFKVWNNVIVASDGGIGVNNAKNVEIYNNIIVGPTKYAGFATQDGVLFNYFDNNIYFNVSKWATDVYITGKEKYYYSFAAWQAGSGFDANSLSENPNFVNAATHDYHIKTGSAVVGRNGVYIGAYPTGSEVVGITTKPKPPTNFKLL